MYKVLQSRVTLKEHDDDDDDDRIDRCIQAKRIKENQRLLSAHCYLVILFSLE